MSYRLSSVPLVSEGGLILQAEDGQTLCSELFSVRVPAKAKPVVPAPAAKARPWWIARRTYTAIRPDALKVTARSEACSYASQADADFKAVRKAKCEAERQAAAGLIPLEAEDGAPIFGESGVQLTSEPIPL